MSSSLLTTKSKKLRPITLALGNNSSFVTYITGQFSEKRSSINAVRTDGGLGDTLTPIEPVADELGYPVRDEGLRMLLEA